MNLAKEIETQTLLLDKTESVLADMKRLDWLLECGSGSIQHCAEIILLADRLGSFLGIDKWMEIVKKNIEKIKELVSDIEYDTSFVFDRT